MKAPLTLFLILILSWQRLNAQEDLYIAYENGFRTDIFSYVNMEGVEANAFALNTTLEGIMGFKISNFTLETGFYYFETYSPTFYYGFKTKEVTPGTAGFGGSSTTRYIIPLRFGYDFLHRSDRFFLKPEMGVIVFLKEGFFSGAKEGSFWYSEGVDSVFTSGDSYSGSFIVPGLELSLSGGYRFKKRLDIYLKINAHTGLYPLFYDTMTHNSGAESTKATSTFQGSSISLQIGLRFYLKKQHPVNQQK